MQIDARRALRSYDQLKLIARTSDPGLGWCNGPAGWNDDMIWYNYISTQIWGWNHSSRYLKMYLYQDVGCLILKGVRSSGFKRGKNQQPFAAKVQSKRLATSGVLTVFCHKFMYVILDEWHLFRERMCELPSAHRTNQRSEVKSICSIRKFWAFHRPLHKSWSPTLFSQIWSTNDSPRSIAKLCTFSASTTHMVFHNINLFTTWCQKD